MQNREREKRLFDEERDRDRSVDRGTEQGRRIDAALVRAMARGTELLDRVNGLKQERAQVDKQLGEIHEFGKSYAKAFESLGRVPGLHYPELGEPGAGPELGFSGDQIIVTDAKRIIGTQTMQGDGHAISCSPAAFLALEIAEKGKIPFRGEDGTLHMLDVRTDKQVYDFYEIWNSFEFSNSGELSKRQAEPPRGPIEAIEKFGIGWEIRELKDIREGDLVQTWVWQKIKMWNKEKSVWEETKLCEVAPFV